MLANQRRRVLRARFERGDDVRVARSVSQADREVPRPALIADSPDRAAFEPSVELRFGPREQRDEIGSVETVANREIRFAGILREPVPRAAELAVVATVDAIADERTQRLGDAARKLDREVRDAAAGIELIRRDDCARRADVDARAAAPAVRRLRCGDRQRQIGVDLAQKEPGTCVAREEQRVLALPANPGLRRQRHFEHRRAVGEDAVAEVSDRSMDACREPLELVAQHLVIVAAERVARYERLGRIAQDLFAVPRRRGAVVHARGDHSQRARNERAGARPDGAVPCHIIHLAVSSRGEPLEQPLLRDVEIGVRDADLLETQCLPPPSYVRGQCRPVGFGRRRMRERRRCRHARKRT